MTDPLPPADEAAAQLIVDCIMGKKKLMSDRKTLIESLRAPANWLREDKGQSWKDGVSRYDRSPFDAADEIERLRSALAYYASPHHWIYGEVPGHVYAHDDAGRKARETLDLPTRIPEGEEFDVELKCREIMDIAP